MLLEIFLSCLIKFQRSPLLFGCCYFFGFLTLLTERGTLRCVKQFMNERFGIVKSAPLGNTYIKSTVIEIPNKFLNKVLKNVLQMRSFLFTV